MNALEQSQGTSSERIYEKVEALLLEPAGPLLDLGCGRGEFLGRLRAHGRGELTGCDGFRFDPGAPLPFEFIQANLNDRLPFGDASFEVVTAIEVIEHLENPRQLVREIARVLRPGGWAVVSTPNNESWLSLVSLGARGYFSAFADSCYPAHITPLLEIDLRRIFREAGMDGVQAAYSDSGRIPGTPWHWQGAPGGAWNAVGKLVFRGKRFSDNLLMWARKPAGNA